MRIQMTRSSKTSDEILKNSSHNLYDIYVTRPPGGMQGYFGADVSNDQSVAVRFVPSMDYYLKKVGLWFMNNGQPNVPVINISLRSDKTHDDKSIPGEEIFETWKFTVSALGWSPVLEELDSIKSVYLGKNVPYWVVAESEYDGHESGVWVMSGGSTGFSYGN